MCTFQIEISRDGVIDNKSLTRSLTSCTRGETERRMKTIAIVITSVNNMHSHTDTDTDTDTDRQNV